MPGGWGRGRAAAAGLAAGTLLSRPSLAFIQGPGLGTPFPAPGTQGYPPMYALGTEWAPNLCVFFSFLNE